jgi:hypothetical protein
MGFVLKLPGRGLHWLYIGRGLHWLYIGSSSHRVAVGFGIACCCYFEHIRHPSSAFPVSGRWVHWLLAPAQVLLQRAVLCAARACPHIKEYRAALTPPSAVHSPSTGRVWAHNL